MKTLFIRLFLVGLITIGIAIAVIYRDVLDMEALQHWIEQSGPLAPLLFMLIYILATIFFLPGSVLTLAGGALFGPVVGVFYNLTAATIGAILSFLAARYLASDWVEKKSAGRLKQLINGVENEGWRFVAFVRLVPIFPFNLLNYTLGLTKIKLLDYSLATYICMLPGAIAYTYLGYIGREAATGGESLIQKSLLGLALLAVAAFLPRFISQMRNNAKKNRIDIDVLKQAMDNGDDFLLLDVRTDEDYVGEQGHISTSVQIPVEQLEQRIAELKDRLAGDYEKRIVTICRTDRKSTKAAEILTNNGFNNVKVVKMGMTDWNKKGYPNVQSVN
ncbi:VTT domain-containing protein [sulfur-oxidizing endosymbiont of Gigantopelta aegis]|uniref:VTT domain-containing protein n=1 Tax=sulfur-oxidizing endosymbiont of Gigantopelta aegis TaxID=2794934 RepID=UPI001FEC54B2|nr:VTT domain-containing protein [sulfur-oxidizing endosymbiont of Gigantopelta aegis]